MIRIRSWAVAVIVAVLFFAVSLAQQAPETRSSPRPSEIKEQVEVRLLQIPVSVIDPKSNSNRSVPGLRFEQFDIRLDGHSLDTEERKKVLFDPVCGPVSEAGPEGVLRRMIAVVDFNFLSAAGRSKVAKALEWLADHAAEGNIQVQVYGITRQIRPLTPGYVSDPPLLKAVAEKIRSINHFEGQLEGTGLQAGGVLTEGENGTKALGMSSDPGTSTQAFKEFGRPNLPGGMAKALQQLEMVSAEEHKQFQSPYHPGASLGALEGILRAHAQLPGRKVVVLFTSNAFWLPQSQQESESAGVIEASRNGFTIWTVDAESIDSQDQKLSPLLSSLAGNTGGRTLRKTGDLAQAFTGAVEQLACYYLFSLPLPASTDETARHNLIVRLDTDRFRDLWGLTVIGPEVLTVPDRATMLRNRRISALLSPNDFPEPPVTAILDYPSFIKGKRVLRSRFRVPLQRLTWEPQGQGVKAKVMLDAVVERDNGRANEAICSFDANSIGVLELRLPAPPRPNSPAGFVIELPCAAPKDGMYTARAALTDLLADNSGGATSTVWIQAGGGEVWQAFVPRIEAASGLDLVWHPGETSALRDVPTLAWRLASRTETARPADRLALRFVLCGPDRSRVHDGVRIQLLARSASAPARPVQSFPKEQLTVADGPAGPFCSVAMLAIPPFSLEPGGYTFAVIDTGSTPTMETVARTADQPEGTPLPTGLLALAPFQIE